LPEKALKPMTGTPLVTLADAKLGSFVQVREIHCASEVSQRLREMGFRTNAILRCVQRGFGNVICEVYNTRVGLDAGLARSILVTQCDGERTEEAPVPRGTIS
jgi:Fe2+ transport system protein FeoA